MKNKIGKIFTDENAFSYNIAEIGINHNGDLNLAKKLIKVSKFKYNPKFVIGKDTKVNCKINLYFQCKLKISSIKPTSAIKIP